MRIAISCHPTQGGSGVVATELAMGLAGRGHEVHLVSDEIPFRLKQQPRVRFHRVRTTDYPLFKYPPHSLSLANKLAEVALDHQIDVIHAHYAVPHAISAIVASQIVKPYRVRVVTTLHGTDITLVGSHRDFYRICRYAMLECDGVTVVSGWLRDQTMKEFNLPTPPVIIPNFVDCRRFSPLDRVGWPAPDEPFQLLHASNFRPVKRVCDIVRVFGKVQRQIPARLVMVGDGPERGLAEELAGELGIGHRVDFVGPQVDVERLYRQSHLFLLLSQYESFGLSALEAMACGTPAVVSRGGGLPEVVHDDKTGLHCDVGSIGATADRIIELLGDESRWRAMSQAAAFDANHRFCLDDVIPWYERLYERVMSGDSAPDAEPAAQR
jgi:N-acetyl-alpha-D-glucosaminyl L-malate synthase BshA